MPKIVDLSHSIVTGMPVFPGSETPFVQKIRTHEKDGYMEHLLTLSTHTGTHIDVPSHIIAGSRTIDEFACEKFYGSGAVIDCTFFPKIEKKNIQEVYEDFGKPDFILFYTQWSEYWGTKQYFNNYPVLTSQAATYLSELPLKGVGIDAVSFDPVEDLILFNHKILLEQNIILVENLRGLKYLTNKEFNFSCLPLKLNGADGSPVRAYAII